MFQKLKIRLIMINVIALTIILLMIFSGIYLLMKQGMQKQAYMLMSTIAEEERVLPPFGAPDARRILLGSFFIKINASGEIITYSSELRVPKEDVGELKEIVLNKGISTGTIATNNYRLHFLKVSKEYGSIVVFLDNSGEENVFRWLLTISICIGLISLTLVFFISLFLANKAIKPVKISWERQNTFVADASHELRTPLAVVTSNLEIIMENETETVGSQHKWLTNVQSELDRLKQLVNDLLFLARSDAEGEELSKEPFDLSSLLYKTSDTFMPLAQKKGIRLVLHNQDDVTLLGNEFRIKQLITILLDNAIKYTSSGGKIELQLEVGMNTFQLSIKDSGEGIPREHLNRIFDRFYRVDQSRSRSHGGSGLGLAIAKCIVDEHKGSIHVMSEVDKGTEFTVVFPIESRCLS
ncbi:sensor histidine kinase [Geosporobacter ferrireducens]|uniref:histidine kinase n=1 Tax=Geosporobacter ferrireducens TaxID=1424294 RepID=A0A1D8GNK7_9FIRM|nr:ATP-binding protein [Geosporobacter ferrireducens]AOT72508.1 histidine kinase [Geosporobacter ferrireducens]MTI58196.1 histidine kinase [Geosporobacter ferrireducens]